MKVVPFVVLGLIMSQGVDAGEILRLKAIGSIKPAAGLIQTNQETGLYIVQWKGAVKESEKAALRALGLQQISYIPDDAFLVKGDMHQAAAAQQLGFVRSVVAYDAGLKMERELTGPGVFSFQDSQKVTVQLVAGSDASAVKATLAQAIEVGSDLIVGEASVGTLWQLASRPEVVWIERYLPMTNMDVAMDIAGEATTTAGAPTGYESGTKVMNAEAAYAKGFTGAGQIVAFADTGLDSGEMNSLLPDFQGQVKSGWAMGLGGKSWGDPMNHGTHVAGSIAGKGASSNGGIRGTAFNAKLVAEGMWSDLMNNIMPPSIPKLFDQANVEGARIHSNSWGAPNSNGRYDSWASQADTWLFNNPDFLAVFAAGNDGADLNRDGVIDEGSVSSPGSSKNVLTVGASQNLLMEGGIQRMMRELRDGNNKWGVEPIASSKLSANAGGMAAFSSRGPTADGRLKPEVVAPGTNIVSARSKHPKADPAMSWGIYDDNYLYMGGTSMATPLTSGAMAIVRENLMKRLNVASVSSALLKATVANTADDLFPGQFGQRGTGQEQPSRRPNNHEGWGRVNLANLVNDDSLQFIDNRQGLATGGEAKVAVTATAGKALRITMAYTDAPASANSARTLVNDLNLSVVSPSGAVLHPNGRSGADNVNNMEQIDVLAPEAGTYQVIVKGANVPQGKNGAQPYALVISSGR